MEQEKDYHNRRIAEIKQRIDILNNYFIKNSELKNTETGVGGSYKKRRNSRNSVNKSYRLSEFKSEIEGLERVLKMHENKLL
jgi:hypothetical protein